MHSATASSRFVVVAIFAATLGGCSSDSRQAATAPRRPSLSRSVSQPQPIVGTCETTFDPPPLPPPPVIRQVDRGSCTMSHLGRASIYSVEDIDIVAGTQQSVEFTYTAADGSILRARNSGTNAPNGSTGVRFSATTTFIGGTGRFANATGQAHVEGTASFLTNTAAYTITGWIGYN